MGTIIAIAILWVVCSRCETRDTRRKQRKVGMAVTAASALWFLESIFNADRHQRY
jgi:ammonia channel protein AmtB